MALLVDTSVWSLAFRRDSQAAIPEVLALRRALESGYAVATTGIIQLELLRGFVPAAARRKILAAFEALEYIEPTRNDYIRAAELSTICQRAGVQFGSVDALIAQIAIAGGHTLLSTDKDFQRAGRYVELRLWRAER